MSVLLYLPLVSPFYPYPRFNIYIYDYCNKRGFRKTARELLQEAEIPADSAPPINAKQGLLFESVSLLFPPFQLIHIFLPQVVECLLGPFHRKKQWRRNRGRYGLHSGAYTDSCPTSSPPPTYPVPIASTKYNRLTLGRARDLSITNCLKSAA